MKKILALVLAVMMLFSVASCSETSTPGDETLKVGFIFLHDENSTYLNAICYFRSPIARFPFVWIRVRCG